MCQVKPNTAGSSTRSTRMSAVCPPVHVIWADPPGRRSILACWPNQLARPSAVVSAAHTLAGGWAISTTRSMRSGNAMTPSKHVASDQLPYYGNRSVASRCDRPARPGPVRSLAGRRPLKEETHFYRTGIGTTPRSPCSRLWACRSVAVILVGQGGVFGGIEPGDEPVDGVAGARQPHKLVGELEDAFPARPMSL